MTLNAWALPFLLLALVVLTIRQRNRRAHERKMRISLYEIPTYH